MQFALDVEAAQVREDRHDAVERKLALKAARTVTSWRMSLLFYFLLFCAKQLDMRIAELHVYTG